MVGLSLEIYSPKIDTLRRTPGHKQRREAKSQELKSQALKAKS